MLEKVHLTFTILLLILIIYRENKYKKHIDSLRSNVVRCCIDYGKSINILIEQEILNANIELLEVNTHKDSDTV